MRATEQPAERLVGLVRLLIWNVTARPIGTACRMRDRGPRGREARLRLPTSRVKEFPGSTSEPRHQALARAARSASAIGSVPAPAMASWKSRSVATSPGAAPRRAKNASRMRAISRAPVRYELACVGHEQ